MNLLLFPLDRLLVVGFLPAGMVKVEAGGGREHVLRSQSHQVETPEYVYSRLEIRVYPGPRSIVEVGTYYVSVSRPIE